MCYSSIKLVKGQWPTDLPPQLPPPPQMRHVRHTCLHSSVLLQDSCACHMWTHCSTIALLYDHVPRQWSPNAADSLTRNVKSVEASHIKIARVPCQHTLSVHAWAPNSCHTHRTTKQGCWGYMRRETLRFLAQETSSAVSFHKIHSQAQCGMRWLPSRRRARQYGV